MLGALPLFLLASRSIFARVLEMFLLTGLATFAP